eukprot:Blabericola_migrator_1__10577@NODE_5_length_29060_cov_171_088642_g4_i0_p15_GENE_NODE_5_length_29060_cov_171_088642_g4_i0NODE_5_length_29060_cov_171_088642_g4_i0_p15_ORF_typecomplete_len270_score43_89_NODE_5_length_29060_cov_171_088642_g4_i049305739
MRFLVSIILAVQAAVAVAPKYSKVQIIDKTSAALEKSLIDFASHFESLRHVDDDKVHIIETNVSSPRYNHIFSSLKPVPVEKVTKWTAYWRLAQKQATWITMPGNDIEPDLAAQGWVQYPSQIGVYYNLSEVLPYVQPEMTLERDLDDAVHRVNPYTATAEDSLVSEYLADEIRRMSVWEKLDLGYYYAHSRGETVASARLTYDGTFALISELQGIGSRYDEGLLKALLVAAKRDGMQYAIMIRPPNDVSRFLYHGFQVSGVWGLWRLF